MDSRFVFTALVTAVVGFANASVAHAGISGPPPSFVIATRDGQHLFVMLSPAPIREDRGNECLLPTGERVCLRDAFPASGLYKRDSKIPIWTVNWYGGKSLVKLSANGRHAIWINEFGGGYYGEGVKPRWGVKFHDAGVEIKSYDVKQLVDFPSLMEFTSSDWHYLWIDEDQYFTQIGGGFYTLRTSTREEYRFDVSTGAIVEQHRFWRHMARGSLGALAVGGALGVWLVFRRRKFHSRSAVPSAAALPINEPIRAGRKWTYSIRSLLILTTLVATFCWVPHIVTFLTALGLAVHFTRKLSASVGRRPASDSNRSKWRSRAHLWPCAVATWSLAYCLSAGPVLGLAGYLHWPTDVQMVLVQVVYAPVYWLWLHTPIRSLPLVDDYFGRWGL